MFIRSQRSANMLKKIYCLFRAEPEEISGFADFEREVRERQIQLEVFDKAVLAESDIRQILLKEMHNAGNSILITDIEFHDDFFNMGECDSNYGATVCKIRDIMPISGLLSEDNGKSLSYKYVFESFEGMMPDYFVMVYSRFYGLPLEIFETERLRVREMTLNDIDRLYEIYADPSITEYMEGLYPDKKDELEFSKSYIENMYGFYGYGLWMVIEKASGRIIGRAGISNREVDGEVYLELGYVIAKESQRQGYATEVSRAIARYAKNELGATQVIALMKPENEASIRTAKKLGFREVCEVTLGEDDRYLEFCKEL